VVRRFNTPIFFNRSCGLSFAKDIKRGNLLLSHLLIAFSSAKLIVNPFKERRLNPIQPLYKLWNAVVMFAMALLGPKISSATRQIKQ